MVVRRTLQGALAAAVVVSGLSYTEQAFADAVDGRVVITTQEALGPPQTNWNVAAYGQYVPHLPDQVLDGARNLFGDRYAGMYFWRAVGHEPILVLRLTEPTAADVDTIAGVLGRPELSFYAGSVAIVPSHLSERVRTAAVSALASNLGRRASVSADPVADAITVALEGRGRPHTHVATPSEAALVRRLGLDKSRSVRWIVTPPARHLSTPHTGTYGSAPIQINIRQADGQRVTHYCTSGFAFTAPSGTFMSMAGHCTEGVDALGWSTGQVNTGQGVTVSNAPNGSYLGWVVTATAVHDGDYAAYTTDAKARQWIGPDRTYYVMGSAKPQIGEWVCFNGTTSGRRCGRVFYVSSDAPGDLVDLTPHQFCIGDNGALDEGAEGDSGAAMWVEDGNNADLTQAVRIRGVVTMVTRDFRPLHDSSQWITCGTTVSWMMQAWNGTVMTEAPPTATPSCSV